MITPTTNRVVHEIEIAMDTMIVNNNHIDIRVEINTKTKGVIIVHFTNTIIAW